MNERTVTGKKIGIIGIGNIGRSLLQGLLAVELGGLSGNVFISDVKRENLHYFEPESRVVVCEDNKEVAEKSDVIILAVKPHDLRGVAEEIAPVVNEEKMVLSVAAGVPTRVIEGYLGNGQKVIRVMPNIGARVGESVTAICKGEFAGDEDEAMAREILSAIGDVYSVKESDMDVITGLSGSGIAFCAAMIEALADGGVYEGLPHDLALEISAKTARGAAILILAGDTPSLIEEMTASPGGTTMRGLYAMESRGVKAAMMEAVIEATKRAREISEQLMKNANRDVHSGTDEG
ncbi:MAG: pyrroline-5-carboxylate reductase [Methanophagales archaeon]|nr:pyrroline-5-carboxylate reductase [Methanophagales archaeon]